jgi:hypothetical protein
MADLISPEMAQFLTDARKFINENQAILTLIILPILGGIGKLLYDRQRNRPTVYLELADVTPIEGNEDVTFCLKAINTGGDPATKARYTWTQRSSLTMTPVPAGFLLQKDEPRCFAFSMKASDVIATRLAGWHEHPLGWIELTYYAGWGLWRQVKTAIYVGETPAMPVQLGKVPRLPWRDYIIPLKNWHEKRLRDKDIENFAQYLQRSREFLAARGIEVKLLFPYESFRRLLGVLQNRGWQWSYGPGGRGFEVYAKKEDPFFSTIRLSAQTAVDAATLVVASAVEDDEQYGL